MARTAGGAWAFAALVAVALAAGPVIAGETSQGELFIRDAWARATIGQGKTGVVYMSISNRAHDADRLVGAETPVAQRAELHSHLHEGGVMKMRRLPAVEIAGAGTAVLAPGGDHLMLMGLNHALAEGASFTVTLVFEKAGRVDVPVAVLSATAMQPMQRGGHGAGHGEGHGKARTH